MDGWTFALTVLTAVFTGGGLGGIILALVSRRKAKSEIKENEAETTEIITRAAGEAVKLMQSQLCKLEAEVETLRAENVELKQTHEEMRQTQARHEKEITELQDMFDVVLAGAHVLHAQVVELNGTPKYKPPERRKR